MLPYAGSIRRTCSYLGYIFDPASHPTNDVPHRIETELHNSRTRYRSTVIHHLLVIGNSHVDVSQHPRWNHCLSPDRSIIASLDVLEFGGDNDIAHECEEEGFVGWSVGWSVEDNVDEFGHGTGEDNGESREGFQATREAGSVGGRAVGNQTRNDSVDLVKIKGNLGSNVDV